MAVPITIYQKKIAIHLATVLITIDPDIRLYPTIKLWPVPSETGETLLVERNGNEVEYLNELRHGKNVPLMMRRPLTELSLQAVRAVLGAKGIVRGKR